MTITPSAGGELPPRVLVLAGGLSYEREVSLRSGRRVSGALRQAGLDVEVRDADATLLPTLAADPPDAVVITLHGASGEGGALRGVLDLVRVPYIGSGAHAARVAWDKPTAKAVLAEAGISTPEWAALPHDTFSELGAATLLDRITDRLGLPLMVKPAQGGSGLGAHVVRDAPDLPAAMVGCFAYGSTALIERHVPGAEIAVSVLDFGDGPEALPAVEIVPHSGVYDYAARYSAGRTTWHTPARLSEQVAAEAAQVAVAAHTALALRDLSRVDLIVQESGAMEVLEVNVAPGMTDTSLLPMALEAASMDLGDVLSRLLRGAIRRGASSAH